MNNKILEKYTTPSFPGSFSGVDKLYRALKEDNPKLKLADVTKELSQHETYTLHRPIKKKYKTSQVVVSGIDDTWQIDLVDMATAADENDDYRYILTVIDVFSKYAWAVASKKKDKNSIADAFNSILAATKRRPKRIQADEGTEFYNAVFKGIMKKHSIKLYSTFSVLKASIVERFNRTLKQKMWRVFTLNKNHEYMSILPQLVFSYNNTYHRSIKTKPVLVNKKNESDIWNTLYGIDYEAQLYEGPKLEYLKLKVGDLVRISKYKNKFEKGYTSNWIPEIFVINKVLQQDPMVYKIKDLESEDVMGDFYAPELQKVSEDIYPEGGVYVIEEILQTRKNTKTKKIEKLVKYIGREATEWITQDQISGKI